MHKVRLNFIFKIQTTVFLLSLSFFGLSFVNASLDTNKADVATTELVVYTSQKEHIIGPILEQYKKETGQSYKIVFDNAAPLLERLKTEGTASKADVILAVDAGNLWLAKNFQLFQKIDSKILKKQIPSHLRDSDQQWFGFSQRARTIVYNPKSVKLEDLKDYTDLSLPKWKGKLCLRTSQHVYNQSLVATLMDRLGEPKAEEVVKGWVQNLAAPTFANDTQLLEAIHAGQCSVGISNSYYLARLLKEKPDLQVKIFWPSAKSGGVHVNIFGGGVAKNSPNPQQSIKFLEWLASDTGQKLMAQANFEYPVKKGIEVDPLVKSWGEFSPSLIHLSIAGQKQAAAVKLMDRAKYQ